MFMSHPILKLFIFNLILGSEEILVEQNKIIGEIPFQWPPINGYLSYRFKNVNNGLSNVSAGSLLSIKHPTNQKLAVFRALITLKLSAAELLLEESFKDSPDAQLINAVLSPNDFDQVNITYHSNSEGKTKVSIYFNDYLIDDKNGDIYRYYGLKIVTGEAVGYVIKDLQYHSKYS